MSFSILDYKLKHITLNCKCEIWFILILRSGRVGCCVCVVHKVEVK
jgi:hypothetical protein